MGELTKINSVNLMPLEIEGQRVLTLAMIDNVHERPKGTAGRNFRLNRDRLIEGQHYWKIGADEFRRRHDSKLSALARGDITLLTERGYLMLVKSFNDELAWQVQDQLVEGYFRAKSVEGNKSAPQRIAVSREVRLTMSQNLRLAKMIGLTGNQAALSASQATAAMTGVDTLRLLGATHINAPQNEALLTPTEIGRRSGLGSARRINQLLCEMRLQTAARDFKGNIYYEPTDMGRNAGGVMQDTGKKHSTGTPVRQLKWASSILTLIEDDMEQQAA